MDLITLARAGDPFPGSAFDAPCHRIPALAVTASGRVLAAWDVRADWRDLPGDFDIALRHSDDHGRTWSEPRALRRHSPGHGYGDASLLVDPATGRIFCWYVGSTGRSFFSAEEGPDGEGLELWVSTSDDDGLTWAHCAMTPLKPRDVTGMFASSGNGTVTASGRLLQPFVLRTASGEHFAAIAHSDDDGATWTLASEIGPDCDESKVVETASGGVVLHARSRPRRRWAIAADGGLTFTTPVAHPALVDPGCNGGLCRWGDLLVCSLLDDERERRRLVVRTSADDGESWSDGVLVDTGAAGYSVLAPLADGALGLLYEAGDYAELVFRRITRAELGSDRSAPTLRPRAGSGSARPPEVAP